MIVAAASFFRIGGLHPTSTDSDQAAVRPWLAAAGLTTARRRHQARGGQMAA
jgi:hypothetical protein